MENLTRAIRRVAQAFIVAIFALIKMLLPFIAVFVLIICFVSVVVSMVDGSGVNENYFTFDSVSTGDTDLKSVKVNPVTTEESGEDTTVTEIPSREVTVKVTPQNAAIKAFYHIMSERSVWQLQDDGTLINLTSDEAKQDYLNRDQGLAVNPNLLYALNEAIYHGETLMYPEQFIKPVAYEYKDGKFTLTDVVDDKGKVTVKSHTINKKNGKVKTKTEKFLGDYGFGSVSHYTEGKIQKTLKGQYISQDVWDADTCKVVTETLETPEDFSIDMGSETCDLLDGTVTFLGATNYETKFEETLTAAVSSGQSSNASDLVDQVLYDTISVDLYKASKDKDTVVDKTEEWCKKNGYTIDKDSKKTVTYNLYKHRSTTSGLYTNAPAREENDDIIVGSFEYYRNYLRAFSGYIPISQGRNAYSYQPVTGIATVADFKKKHRTAEGGGSGGSGSLDYVKDFIEMMTPLALEAQKESGISAAIIVAQAALESNWGRSDLAAKDHNYFGIKWTKGCGHDYAEYWTTEGSGASKVRIRAKFRSYEDPLDCLRDWCKLIWNGKGNNGYRYRGAVDQSYADAIATIYDGGYCTADRGAYIKSVVDTVEANNLQELENDPAYQWDGTPPDYADSDDSGSGGKKSSIKDAGYAGSMTEEDVELFDRLLNIYLEEEDEVTTDYISTRYAEITYHPSDENLDDIIYTAVAFSNHLYKSEVDYYDDAAIMQVLLGDSEKSSNKGSSYYVGDGEFIWVVPSCTTITSPFGNRGNAVTSIGGSSYHRGIDIGCQSGSDVVATKDGKVVVAEQSNSEGLWIMLDHGDGVKSVYMHNSQLLVKAGDEVKQGQVIAKSGSTGISTGPHCHFGIQINGEYVNPLDYVNPNAPVVKKGGSSGDGTTDEDFQDSDEKPSTTEIRKKIVKYAKKFLGNPYVYGGTSLTNGTDCSGFTMSIYKHFGITIPRTAAAQCNATTRIKREDLLPGDLLFYQGTGGSIGHVTMYIGGGKVIHASSPTTGIIISNISYRTPCSYGRVKGIEKAKVTK